MESPRPRHWKDAFKLDTGVGFHSQYLLSSVGLQGLVTVVQATIC